jgi:protease IV
MKRSSYVLILVLIFLVLAGAAAVSYFLLDWSRPVATVPSHAYLDIGLGGEIREIAPSDFWSSLFPGLRPLAMNDLWMNIRKAKADDRVDAILLRLGLLDCDWAKVSEIRDAIIGFRKSGKKVIAYIEEAPDFDKEYYLATACDRIVLHPMGWLGINGIGGYIPFFKNALEKIGIRAEFEHVEEYKTAYNQFTEKGFTPAHKEMMESLYGDIFARYVKTLAAARKKTEEEIRALIDHGFYQGRRALEAGLVDDLLYEDELQNSLQTGGRKLRAISFADYSRVGPESAGLGAGRRIAVIYGVGPIVPGESLPQMMGGATVARWIRQARQDSSIAAIVFRVDSPGGSSVASDVIWRETFLAKKEKPFVVSMSDMAGSGGYWVSMAAHRIIAQPQTLTGSIGVLAGKVDFSGLLDKLGVTSERIAFGRESDVFTPFRPFTPDERKILKGEILWTYDQFVTKVAEGRNLTREEVNKIGRGRVWTGSQAKEIKLVDELGGLTEAIEQAKKLAGIPAGEDVRLVVWPKKRSFFDTLFGGRASDASLRPDSDWKALSRALRLLTGTRVWAVMPFWLEAR